MMKSINKVLLVGTIALVNLALYGIYRVGCQQGVETAERFVHKYEPEAYDRLTSMMNDSQA